MNEKFNASKNILDIVEFDKSHQLWRVCANQENTYAYSAVKKASIIETLKKDGKASTIMSNIASTMAAPVSFAQTSADVKVQIKVMLVDDCEVIFDISKDYVKQNTLDYHKDKRNADEIKKTFKVIEKRNKE